MSRFVKSIARGRSLPHEIFAELHRLEIERLRQAKERASLSRRLEQLDRRTREIEGELAELLERANQERATQPVEKSTAAKSAVAKSGALRIRY